MHVIPPSHIVTKSRKAYIESDITYFHYTIYKDAGKYQGVLTTKRQDPVLHLSKLKVDKENKAFNQVNTQRYLLLACLCRFIYSISLNLLSWYKM